MKNFRQNDRRGEHCVRNSQWGNHDLLTPFYSIRGGHCQPGHNCAVECPVLSAPEFSQDEASKIAAARTQSLLSDVRSASKICLLQSLACFFFSAFFQGRLARKFHTAFV